jgi:type VII secretion-associated serine protease mycosin
VSDGQWFHAFLHMAEVHKITKGAGVTVAVIDSGVDASHPDLSGSVLPGADFSSQGPGDGRKDTRGHGTGMAGFVAGHGRVKGIAPAAKILPVRTASGDFGSSAALAEGINWATAQHADIISISQALDSDDLLMQQSVEAALRADIVVVAGVGNLPQDSAVGYPAAYPGVLAVAGVDRKGNHSAVSVTGLQVMLSAPSDGLSSTYPNSQWSVGTGTSSATAIVAGAAALIRSRFPDLSATEVVHRLTATAIDKGAKGRDSEYGYGVLNLVGALTANVPPLTPSASPTPTKANTPPTQPSIAAPDTSSSPLPGLGLVCLGSLLLLGAISGAAFWSIRRKAPAGPD